MSRVTFSSIRDESPPQLWTRRWALSTAGDQSRRAQSQEEPTGRGGISWIIHNAPMIGPGSSRTDRQTAGAARVPVLGPNEENPALSKTRHLGFRSVGDKSSTSHLNKGLILIVTAQHCHQQHSLLAPAVCLPAVYLMQNEGFFPLTF